MPSPDALQAGCDRSKKETAAAAMAVAHHSLEIRHPVSAKTLAAATILKRVSVISFLQPHEVTIATLAPKIRLDHTGQIFNDTAIRSYIDLTDTTSTYLNFFRAALAASCSASTELNVSASCTSSCI
ncbi:hypothetical protein [Pseudomonas azotoformans]|uniref:hypothetical protein n=1 Tax=Pseudomonas azotoformans TaxID=47878 RepID=UPI001F2C03B5|nr:hypothetical protein [Pseudomonas azotoformans]